MQPSIRSLLSNRGFVLLWCAYGISAMGDHLSEMAILAHMGVLEEGIDVTPLQARMTFVFMRACRDVIRTTIFQIHTFLA